MDDPSCLRTSRTPRRHRQPLPKPDPNIQLWDIATYVIHPIAVRTNIHFPEYERTHKLSTGAPSPKWSQTIRRVPRPGVPQ